MGSPRRWKKTGKRVRRTCARISSSCSAESNCIQGIEAAAADPHLLLCPNWADHLTAPEPACPCLRFGNSLYSLVLSTNC